MHLFNAKRLSDQLRADAVSEEERFRYLLTLVAVQYARRVFTPAPQNPTPIYYGFIFLTVVISGLGLWICFRANQSGDNREFMNRFFCPSIPIGIWYSLIYFSLVDGSFYLMRVVAGAYVHQLQTTYY